MTPATISQKTHPDIQLKADGSGAFKATIATFNVVDKDGDVSLPGSFPVDKQIVISAYGHKSWEGALPVGVGTIGADNQRAFVTGRFFLNSSAGRDTYETLKSLQEAGQPSEWSHGYEILEGSVDPQELAQWPGAVRILKRLDVVEASAVLVGAGVGTGTEWLKSHRRKATVDAAVVATIAQIDAVADALDEDLDTLMDELGIPDPDEIAEGETEEPTGGKQARRRRLIKALKAASSPPSRLAVAIANLDFLADLLDELVDTLMDQLGIPDPDEIAEGEPEEKSLNQVERDMLRRDIALTAMKVADILEDSSEDLVKRIQLRAAEVSAASLPAETVALAAKAVSRYSRMLGILEPELKWFTASNDFTRSVRGAAVLDRKEIWVRGDQDGSDFLEVVAHEVKHIAGGAEREAWEFGINAIANWADDLPVLNHSKEN